MIDLHNTKLEDCSTPYLIMVRDELKGLVMRLSAHMRRFGLYDYTWNTVCEANKDIQRINDELEKRDKGAI